MGGTFALLCTMERRQLIPPPKVRKNRGGNFAHLGTLKPYQRQTPIRRWLATTRPKAERSPLLRAS